jgi:hypothetical protein
MATEGSSLQIVMGQKFEFDEGASEEIAFRVPLPIQKLISRRESMLDRL